MSFKIKFTLGLFIVLTLVFPLFLKGPDGRPLMTISDWIPDVGGFGLYEVKSVIDISASQQVAEPVLTAESQGKLGTIAPKRQTGGAGKMYKWQDEQGRWHFSSEQPAQAHRVSVEDLPSVENVMEAPVRDDKNRSISLPGGFGFGGNQ